jgi:hypothetical protein
MSSAVADCLRKSLLHRGRDDDLDQPGVQNGRPADAPLAANLALRWTSSSVEMLMPEVYAGRFAYQTDKV